MVDSTIATDQSVFPSAFAAMGISNKATSTMILIGSPLLVRQDSQDFSGFQNESRKS
jgi:hypothetical protein